MFMRHIGGGVGHSFVNPKQGIEGGTATNDGHEDDNIGGTEEGDDGVIDYQDDLDDEDDLDDGEEDGTDSEDDDEDELGPEDGEDVDYNGEEDGFADF